MSLVDTLGTNLVPGAMARMVGPFGLTNFTMDEAADLVGGTLVIPRTGTLSKIGFRVGTVTTSDTLKVALEGIDATNGRPDGTVTPTNASGTQGSLSSNTTYWVALNGGSGVSVTKGDKAALTLRWNSYVAGNIAITYCLSSNTTINGFPYIFTYNNTGAVWALNGYNPNFALEYSDGVVEPVFGLWPAISTSGLSWNNSTTPDRRGLRFSLPYKATIIGVWVNIDSDGNSNILMYDSDGVTLLENIAIDSDIRYSTSAGTTQFIPFSTPRTLAINTFYRIVILPASATNNSITNFVVVDDGANVAMNAIDGGVNFHYTTCNGAPANEAAWTQTLTTRPPIALVVSQLDDGAGGSGGNSGPWGMIR